MVANEVGTLAKRSATAAKEIKSLITDLHRTTKNRLKAMQYKPALIDGFGWLGTERIPLTIADADPAAGTISLVIQSIGKSTADLVELEPGDAIRDIAGPLGISYPDGERLWHIARLAHRTIPYAFMRAGAEPPGAVYMELNGPSGEAWTFGETSAPIRITGDAGELCRIAARRLPPAEASSVTASGERADEVLDLIRTYA